MAELERALPNYGWTYRIDSVSASLGVVLVLYVIGLVIYRLTLHPLAHYPGPFFSRISGFSIFQQARTRRRHLIQLREHELYGPIVRIGPNTLSFSSPNALHQIYQSGLRDDPLEKSEWYELIDAPTSGASLHTEISTSKHAHHRHILSQAFSASAIRTYDTSIHDSVEVFKHVLAPSEGEVWSPARNMKDRVNWFTYDVMGLLVFGRRFDCMTEAKHRYVPKIMMASSAFTYMAGYLPFQSIVRRLVSSPALMSIISGDLGRDEHAYVQYATECMSARLEQAEDTLSSGHRDIMHYILQASRNYSWKGQNIPLSRADLDADASLLIAAGADTTALTLSALFFYLTLPDLQHVLQKLQTEIRDSNDNARPTPASTSIAQATALPYLRACLDEALRLAPAVPTHLPRTVRTRPGITIDGHCVAAGMTVGAAAYVLHHDEEVFTQSWNFDPDRWYIDPDLTSSQKEQKETEIKKMRKSFIPFSLGSRGCIGRDLAYREMSYCVAQLIQEFDFKRADLDCHAQESIEVDLLNNRRGEYTLYDCFLADRQGPWIVFKKAR